MLDSKKEKIKNFDPNGIGIVENGIFGLPFNEEESEIVIIEVPWDVTVSSGSGTDLGPDRVRSESYQVDLYLPWDPTAWQRGIFFKENPLIIEKSKILRKQVESIIDQQEDGVSVKELQDKIDPINQECEWMIKTINKQSLNYLQQGKVVGLLGGDHSTPLGLIQACAEYYDCDFSILQIDAHCDLREAYEGFIYSHASIMTNALKIPQVKKLVQVGIRDYSEGEAQAIKTSEGRIETFFDKKIKDNQYTGMSWETQCINIINQLSENVYLSFDIDGLQPSYCPNTGTPVMGGFEPDQILYLIETILESGRTIIAFDINEIGNGEWDGNVGARLLYKIANMVYNSQKRI